MTKRKAFIKRKRKVLHITGLKVAYFIICKRKLWLFSRNITGEHTSEYVEIGKLIEKQFFKDKNKFENFGDNPIRIDFISSESGKLSRENNTIEKKFLPIENTSDIYIFSEIIRGVSFHEKSIFQENYWFYNKKVLQLGSK
jgi:CRISPR/Cas system-associated exonuclease Cas4 (RecB family)